MSSMSDYMKEYMVKNMESKKETIDRVRIGFEKNGKEEATKKFIHFMKTESYPINPEEFFPFVTKEQEEYMAKAYHEASNRVMFEWMEKYLPELSADQLSKAIGYLIGADIPESFLDVLEN